MFTPLEILQKSFGYPAFREHQEAIVENILGKKDTFVLMPTGGGKSLCYQLPALMMDGLTLVISPLIALMKDQVDALRLNGIAAAYLNSSLPRSDQYKIMRQVKANELKLLYLAPERLMKTENEFFVFLKNLELSLIAIDEAHCISQWGHDFRPEYLMLARLKNEFPNVPVIALTATADHQTRKDILEKLELKNPATFVSSFNRPNIRYDVAPKQNSIEMLRDFLEKRKQDAGIIYCLSRASTESVASQLQMQGFKAAPYHAGLERQVRTRHQDWFLKDEIKIIVATIAFGMGIDKSNVRFVVHMDLPKSIESYYQETGRAGRDGLESRALLFYSYGDVAKLKRFAQVNDNPVQTRINLKKLDKMSMYGELTTCRRKFLLNYFGEEAADDCGHCDVCLNRSGGEVTKMIDRKSNKVPATMALTQLPHDTGLFHKLRIVRKVIANGENVPAYIVLSDATLVELATYLPQSIEEFSKISGFGEYKLEKYGMAFCEAIREYCQTKGLTSRINLKKPKGQRKPYGEKPSYTKQQSFDLFKKGISIDQVAQQRNLSIATIEGHLAYYIESGALDVNQIVAPEKITIIKECIRQHGTKKLTPLKEALGDGYSFGEICAVIAHLNFIGENKNLVS